MKKQLIIPFVIKAYAASDNYSDTYKPPRWAPDYTKIYSSALGSKLTPPAFTEYASCLNAGIHLHFILPDAFRHGGPDGEGFSFPTVPNRYIVTRMYKYDGKIRLKCFVIESDYISKKPDSGKSAEDCTVIPYLDGSSSPYRFMGRFYEAGGAVPPGEYLSPLTTVIGGDPMFASYYPTCKSVFGWYDDMEGVPDECELTYFVTGYFGNKKDDPFSEVTSAESFKSVLDKYNFTVDSAEDYCESCVLFGEAADIQWKGKSYRYEDMEPPVGEIDVTMGETSAEAMSAILAAEVLKGKISDDNLEYSLTQLQYDLLKQHEQTDGNFKIDDEIHRRTFRELDPLEEYDELINENTSEELVSNKEYIRLRALQRELGKSSRKLSYTKKKLYYAWEQYIQQCEMYSEDAGIFLEEINRLIDEISSKGLESWIESLKKRIEEKRKDVLCKLPGYTLKTRPARPFYIPCDPAVMVSGDGIISAFKFDSRETGGALYCQTEPQSSEKIKKEAVLEKCSRPLPEFSSFDYNAMLYQAVLNSKNLSEIFGAGDINISGKISELAVNKKPEQLLQLFMDWQVEYRYINDTASLNGWSFKYGDTGYTYEGSKTGGVVTVSGRIPLTPHAAHTLADRLKEYDKDWRDIYDLPFISQQLSGFTEEITGLRQVFQLPVTYDTRDISKRVENYVENDRLSVSGSELFPMLGGYLSISKLNIVGSFGQKQIVVQNGIYNKSRVHFPSHIKVSKEGTMGLFPLGIASYSRLSAEFESPEQDNADGSPIYGVILPELLNRRLIIYDRNGEFMGQLKNVYREGETRCEYVGNELTGVLRSFADGLIGSRTALRTLMDLIQAAVDKTLNACSPDFVWGVPLVLTGLRVTFEFFGGAEYSKRSADFGKYDDKGAENLKIPLKFGNILRVTDGTVGVYSGGDFSRVHAMWGYDAKDSGGYLAMQSLTVSAAEGDSFFTALMIPGNDMYIETGLLPTVRTRIKAEYVKSAKKIVPVVEINPIISDTKNIRLPVPNGFSWQYSTEPGNKITADVLPPENTITDNFIMDGALIKKHVKKGTEL